MNLKTVLNSRDGFTLVELAIVMIIIGLLIGGILKGQELVQSARVTATVAQIKGIQAAVLTFHDKYNAVPGDMVNPAQRLSCGSWSCSVGGNGNGHVDNGLPGGIDFVANPYNAASTEQVNFWLDLGVADLMTGIGQNQCVAGAISWGLCAYPASKMGEGGLVAGWYPGGSGLSAIQGTQAASAGTYLALQGTMASKVGSAPADSFLTPNQAMRFDSKLDDGAPNNGSVRAAGFTAAGANGCASANDGAGIYNEALGAPRCSLYIKIGD